jgi:hypothetical protein
MLLAHLRGHALRAAFPKEDAPISHITEITESGTVRPAASASGSASTTATLAELNFSEQLGPGTLNKLQQERQRRVNVNDVSQAFVAAYCAGAPELVHAPSFLRMALQAYGREMIVAAEFERDAWSPEGRRQSVVEGAAALGAAGTRDSDAEAASKRAVIAISDGQRERGVAQEYQYQDLDQSPLGYISLLLSARQGVES